MRKQVEGQYDLSEYSIPEAQIRLAEGSALFSSDPISSPEAAARVIGDKLLKNLDREYLIAMSLDNQLRPINYSVVSVGTVNRAVAEPREIMKSLILSNASSFMIMHNHPSGRLDPSTEDLMLTSRMANIGELMGIPMTDHVIVGGRSGDLYSFREHGLLDKDFVEQMCKAAKEPESRYMVSEAKPEIRTAKKTQREQISELAEQLKEGVQSYIKSDGYKAILDAFSRFHHYSLNNSLLILMQNPAATQVASFTTWKAMGRYPEKGEHGLKILCPAPYKKKAEVEVTDPKTGEKRKEETEIPHMAFKVGYVFDVSQTDGKPLPEVAQELQGDIPDQDLIEAVKRSVPTGVAVETGPIDGEAKGYFNFVDQKIFVKEGMSDAQTLKTLLHETAHSWLHDPSKNENNKTATEDAEIQAESVAYIVSKHYGVNTDEYSFPYVGTWAGGDINEVMSNLDAVKDCSAAMIDKIDSGLQQIREEKQTEGFFKTESGYLDLHRQDDGSWTYKGYGTGGKEVFSGKVETPGLTISSAARAAGEQHGYKGTLQKAGQDVREKIIQQHKALRPSR